MNKTVLDTLLSEHPVTCQVKPVSITPDDIVHVVGSQEPVREHPDERARALLHLGWLKIESIHTTLSESERASRVAALQQAARNWLKRTPKATESKEREQVRWLLEKTRSHESKQQVAQRVWLTMVLYSLDHRGFTFDSEGQISWESGVAGRIGVSPDAALDLAWEQDTHRTYTASFRQPNGTITRGKGRRRWYVYALTIDPMAKPLFKRRIKQIKEKVALIVASETHATQPQLPRDFYGGDAFQQACIDAQDQQFAHILVLSPEHGVISLDDIVPSEQFWDDVLDRGVWAWQALTIQRLGMYLYGELDIELPQPKDLNWWAWLNPESTYEITIFGGGFAARILIDHLLRAQSRTPLNWPVIVLAEQRPGYDAGDFDNDMDFDFELGEDFADEFDLESALQDIDQLLEWAGEFVSLVTVFVPPTGEMWELAPDEALIPVRLLAEVGLDVEELLDLLTDINLLLEQPVPISMLINAGMVVSVLLQITHSLVHNEREPVHQMLNVFPENVLRQYIESALQETEQEDQLCACLTLAEQIQLISLTIPPATSAQLLIWLQTYLAARMRQRLLGNADDEASGLPLT